MKGTIRRVLVGMLTDGVLAARRRVKTGGRGSGALEICDKMLIGGQPCVCLAHALSQCGG